MSDTSQTAKNSEDAELTADQLLERAHDMLNRAHMMLGGWQQAVDWHTDYEKFKMKKARD
jgi:hypothetical protein